MHKKRMMKSFLLAVLLISFFTSIVVMGSTITGRVNSSTGARIRTGPGTQFSEATNAVSNNTVLTLVNTAIHPDESTNPANNCPLGWNEVFIPGSTTQTGFICREWFVVSVSTSTVVPTTTLPGATTTTTTTTTQAGTPTPNPPGQDQWLRPWLSPGLSIIGGAIWQGERYIGRHQNTKYLMKFNVHPSAPGVNASNYRAQHQYMTNIQAPHSEARTKFNSYNPNGLLDRPLIFIIPVYTSMPSSTTHPTGAFVRGGRQTTITDQAFEDYMDAQGFPVSYRPHLRWIRARRPNWVFRALHTNIRWSTLVTAQTGVGAIQLTASNPDQRLCQVQSNGKCRLLEGTNWWRPTEAATAFFLDPRNFLFEERILQFETLSFATYFRERDVQTILNGTHQAGRSPLDNNRTFADLYMEAGRRGNVNPVHLASLSRQELGAWGRVNNVQTVGVLPVAARGHTFTYRNITYTGLFNFYNIGAFSSSTNPVLAGLAWAAGSSTVPIISGTVRGDLHLRGYRVNGTDLSGIPLGTTRTILREQFPTYVVTVVNNTGANVGANTRLKTGYKVTFTKDGESTTYNVIIRGDVTGTGRIDIADLVAIRRHLLGQKKLNGPFLTAADTDRDGNVNIADLVRLRQHLLKQRTITQ